MIEILLVVAAVGFLVLLIANLPSSVASISKSRHASLAREIANKEMDFLRKKTYANLALGTNTFTDPGLDNLPTPSASYEVTDCPVQVCSGGEKVKQIKVTVAWNEGGSNKSVELVTLIGENGVAQ